METKKNYSNVQTSQGFLENIHHMHYIHGNRQTGYVTSEREDKSHYISGNTVSGTKSCHHFDPTSVYTIGASNLKVLFIGHSFLDMLAPRNETVESLKPNDDAMWIQ